jgi:hypothetical protein
MSREELSGRYAILKRSTVIGSVLTMKKLQYWRMMREAQAA